MFVDSYFHKPILIPSGMGWAVCVDKLVFVLVIVGLQVAFLFHNWAMRLEKPLGSVL